MSWWKEMAFGTAFAMKPPVVKAKMGKKVVSAMYVAIKKCPLELVLFAEYIFEDLKNQLLNFGTLMFLRRKEIMLNGPNRKYI